MKNSMIIAAALVLALLTGGRALRGAAVPVTAVADHYVAISTPCAVP